MTSNSESNRRRLAAVGLYPGAPLPHPDECHCELRGTPGHRWTPDMEIKHTPLLSPAFPANVERARRAAGISHRSEARSAVPAQTAGGRPEA